jgi:hypothetical protein
MITKFRQQIHALGAFWIIIGSAAGAAGLGIFRADTADNNVPIAAIMLVVGGGWIVVGILSCLKYVGAVYVGLVVSYISLLVQVLTFNICPIIILIVVILQAHRVIGWARQLRRAGIPLATKP